MDHHHSPKKAKIAADDVVFVTIDQLDDVLADVFGWLRVEEIMGKRCVCKKWKEAAKKTIVPPTTNNFRVECVENYNAMGVMTTELPNLQQITLYGHLGEGERGELWAHKYSEGEDPNEEYAAETADRTSHDIGIISNFSKLRELTIFDAGLNGRYPFLFNSFPLLQKLTIMYCPYLKWDLDMLAGLPLLKELECHYNTRLTGNINSLRVLKGTLEKVTIDDCPDIEGNFMDLADFPRLKTLHLNEVAVTGDIRDIGEHDFSSLEQLYLPKSVYGGKGCELQRISDAPDLMRALNLLKKKIPALDIKYWYGKLSEDSPDWYAREDNRGSPPFFIQLVEAGSRLGYRWTSNEYGKNPCEANWLDPEPDRESSDYEEYIEESQWRERKVNIYRGFHQPPTEEEYHRLWEEEVRRFQIDDGDYWMEIIGDY